MRISDWSSDVCSSDLPKSRSVRPLGSFARGISRNHCHVWGVENYTVEQVSNDAEPNYGVKQGDWHLTDEFPVYTTQSEASVSVRSGAHTLCVTAADRSHDIFDPKVYHCVDVSEHL